MLITYETPTIQKQGKGAILYWKGYVGNADGKWYTFADFWQGLGKVQRSAPVEVKPKSMPTPESQAMFEIGSAMTRKRDEGYREEGEELESKTLPMLAQVANLKKLAFPVYLQPKLDGMRALYNGEDFWSRKGKEINPECIAHLKSFRTDFYEADGELMLPAPYDFQDTMSACKKFDPEVSPLLRYHVFDIVSPFDTFETRTRRVSWLVNEFNKHDSVISVPTYWCEDMDTLKAYHTQFVAEGYEGSIIRDIGGLYEVNTRSKYLLKYKDFVDAEFLVVDIVDGVGKEKGAAILVCATSEGKSFNTRMKGNLASRKAIFENKGDYVGRMATVRYQNLTTDGIPRFPVGVGFRND